MAVDVEASGIFFAACSAEGVDGLTDLHIDEANGLEEFLPACARQATGNSTGPEINLASCRFGHRVAIGNVGELEGASRP